jgi:hypothetical protein
MNKSKIIKIYDKNEVIFFNIILLNYLYNNDYHIVIIYKT